MYDPKKTDTEEEYLAWKEDNSYLEERDWGSQNEDLEVVPRVSLPSNLLPLQQLFLVSPSNLAVFHLS